MRSRKRRLAAHRASRDELLSAIDARSRPEDDLVDLFGPEDGSGRPGPAAAEPVDGDGPRRRPRRHRRVREQKVPEGPGPGDDGPSGRVRAAMWSVGWAIMCLGGVVAVSMGAPVLGHGWQWRWLVAGAAVAVAGAALVVGNRPERPARTRWLAPTAAVTVLVLLAVGAQGSILIDGRPVLVGSTQARAHQEVLLMEEDLELLVEIDELLVLPTSEARARSREIIDMRPRAESLSARWANTRVDALPTGEFAPVAVNLKAASFAASEALARKEALLGSNDARITAELESFRATLVQEVLAAGPPLLSLGELYDVDVQLGAPRERE